VARIQVERVDSVSGLLWAMIAGAAQAANARTREQLTRAVDLLLRRPPWIDPPSSAHGVKSG
jgi:hypothetical protein